MASELGIEGLEGVEHVASDGFVTTYLAHDVELRQTVTVVTLPQRRAG